MNTRDPKFLLEKWDTVLLNVAFGHVLETIENGICRYCYAHESLTLLEQSAFVATEIDLSIIYILLSITDIIDSCSRERSKTTWILHKLAKITLYAVLLGEIPMECRDAALPDLLVKNLSIKCSTFGEYTENRTMIIPFSLEF